MLFFILLLSTIATLFVLVHSQEATDSIRDAGQSLSPSVSPLTNIDIMGGADDLQSGYLPNHKMDPLVVDSTNFGICKINFKRKKHH
jgi:hypothetical protein